MKLELFEILYKMHSLNCWMDHEHLHTELDI
nr:MAG TPA: hypothetical protein [Caudoviricetes sp.]